MEYPPTFNWVPPLLAELAVRTLDVVWAVAPDLIRVRAATLPNGMAYHRC
jgi:hypothetical protein